jgi:hypothetical protein
MLAKRMRMNKLTARLISCKSTGFSVKLEEERRMETGNCVCIIVKYCRCKR